MSPDTCKAGREKHLTLLSLGKLTQSKKAESFRLVTISFYVEADLQTGKGSYYTITKEFKPQTHMDIIKITLNEFKSTSPEELHSRTHRINLEDTELQMTDKSLIKFG